MRERGERAEPPQFSEEVRREVMALIGELFNIDPDLADRFRDVFTCGVYEAREQGREEGFDDVWGQAFDEVWRQGFRVGYCLGGEQALSSSARMMH